MKDRIKTFFLLHVLLAIYSAAGICSKLAAGEKFLSPRFIILYGILLCVMFFYAIMWQQILKRMKLVTAYANKSVTIIWGLIWGVCLFGESITVFKLIGIAVIIIGVYFVVTGEEKE